MSVTAMTVLVTMITRYQWLMTHCQQHCWHNVGDNDNTMSAIMMTQCQWHWWQCHWQWQQYQWHWWHNVGDNDNNVSDNDDNVSNTNDTVLATMTTQCRQPWQHNVSDIDDSVNDNDDNISDTNDTMSATLTIQCQWQLRQCQWQWCQVNAGFHHIMPTLSNNGHIWFLVQRNLTYCS